MHAAETGVISKNGVRIHSEFLTSASTTLLEQARFLNTTRVSVCNFPILSEEGTRVADPQGWCHPSSRAGSRRNHKLTLEV